MFRFISFLRGILNHPLNSQKPFRAIYRAIKWQIWYKRVLFKEFIEVAYLNDCMIRVNKAFPSSTGVLYFDIPEYREMVFLLNYLDRDIFVDVGANIGIYSILAARKCECSVHAFEPDTAAFSELIENLALNNINCNTYNVALGEFRCEVQFTNNLNSENHIVDSFVSNSRVVQCHTLSEFLEVVNVVKMDVEGFELQVLKGAHSLLCNSSCMVLVIEIKKHSQRYGYSGSDVFNYLERLGFVSVCYSIESNKVYCSDEMMEENYLFVKDVEAVNKRLMSKGKFVW